MLGRVNSRGLKPSARLVQDGAGLLHPEGDARAAKGRKGLPVDGASALPFQ